MFGELKASSRYPKSAVIKGELDATLAANLPSGAVDGDLYLISVGGTFENDASIVPSNAEFSAGDKIMKLGSSWYYQESGDSIDEIAFINALIFG